MPLRGMFSLVQGAVLVGEPVEDLAGIGVVHRKCLVSDSGSPEQSGRAMVLRPIRPPRLERGSGCPSSIAGGNIAWRLRLR